MLWLIVGLMLIVFMISFFVGIIKVAKAKKSFCPNCEKTVQLVANTAKCPFCKTKLYKHTDGEYRISP